MATAMSPLCVQPLPADRLGLNHSEEHPVLPIAARTLWHRALRHISLGAALSCATLLLSFSTSVPANRLATQDPQAMRREAGVGAAGTLRMIGAYPEERGIGHTVSTFPDGRLFVYGHSPGVQAIDTIVLDPRRRAAELSKVAPVLWDPKPDAWRIIESPPECQFSQYLHTATVLDNDRILIAGGVCDIPRARNSQTPHKPHRALSIWNDRSRQWEAAPSLIDARIFHTATALGNGGVLLIGGERDTRTVDDVEPVLGSVELFEHNRLVPLAPLRVPRAMHTATRMPDGSVVVVGGMGASGKALDSVEIWNPETRTWTEGPTLQTARLRHSATLLRDGRLMVAGGAGPNGTDTAEVEILDAGRNSWSRAAPLLLPLRRHSAMGIGGGDVLVVGVDFDDEHSMSHVMLWSQATAQWRPAGHLAPDRYRDVQSYLLAPLSPQGCALVFDFRRVMLWCPSEPGASERSPYGDRDGYASVLMQDGRIMLAGGRHLLPRRRIGEVALDWVEIFDPESGRFSLTGRLNRPLRTPSALVLSDGRVVVAGNGQLDFPPTREPPLAHAEIWSPHTGQWSTINGMRFPSTDRARFEAMAKLDDERVLFLVSMFEAPEKFVYRALIWNPRTGAMETRPVGARGRRSASIAIHSSGQVYIFGGRTPIGTKEIWGGEIWDSSNGDVTPVSYPEDWETNVMRALALQNGNILWVYFGYWSSKTAAVAIWNTEQATWQTLPPVPKDEEWHVLKLQLAELYDGTLVVGNMWLPPGSTSWIPKPRYPQAEASRMQLPSGKLLALSSSPPHVAYFEEETGKWRLSAPYYLPRSEKSRPVLLELTDGRVMLTGRLAQDGASTETLTQIWNAASDSWTSPGWLAGDYAQAAEAILLPSGQVMHLGLDPQGRLQCEIGHPSDNIWNDCGASKPVTKGSNRLDVGSLRDGRVALRFSQSEIYLYSEKTEQWTLGKPTAIERDEPKWNTRRYPLPNGCSVSGLPVLIHQSRNGKTHAPNVPVIGIHEQTARMTVLADSTLVIAGHPDGTADQNLGFFHRKISCAGYESKPDDRLHIPAKYDAAAPTVEAEPVAVVVSDWEPLANITDRLKWIALAILGPILVYFVLRRLIRRVNTADPDLELPGYVKIFVRAVVYGLILCVLLYLLRSWFGRV
jgi:hypothetical protein